MAYVGLVTAGGSTYKVAQTLYGTCDTAASTQAKVVTCDEFDTLIEGVTINVKFTNANTIINPTLNVNGTGAKSVITTGYQNAVADGSATTYAAAAWQGSGAVLSFTYDGTNWVMHGNGYYNNTTYETVTQNELSYGTSTSRRVITPKVIHDYVAGLMGDMAGALVYKGTVSAGSELLNTALSKGWYYIVDTAGSYAGSTCEPGDMIIVNTAGTYTTATALGAAVDIIQTNIDTISNSEIDTIVAS